MELQPGSLGALTLRNQLPWKMSKNCEPTGLERAQAEATQNGHEIQEEGDVPTASLTRCPRLHME